MLARTAPAEAPPATIAQMSSATNALRGTAVKRKRSAFAGAIGKQGGAACFV
jgi:hypothetical protein